MEAKVVDFINLIQGGMSVHKYSFKFTKLSKYAPSLVSYPREEIILFVTMVSDDLQEECHSAMSHDNMNIHRLIVHGKHMEEASYKWKSGGAKREWSFDGGSSKKRLEIQQKAKFKKRISNKLPSKFPKARDDKVT